ncbi:MAG: nitronate monooxygenase [Deltaproteobacteria bacterium]|nr:nitronate monooxygenase [Deltaproteobacteria bacterium]
MAKNPLHTKLCDSLGIEYPLIAFTHCKDVVAAVTNAGAFAVMGETQNTPDEIAADIKWIREKVGNKPFGIDLVLPASVPPSGTIADLKAQIPKEQREYAEGIKKRYGLSTPKEQPFVEQLGWLTQETPRKQLEVVLDEKVAVLASGLGNPDFILDAAHERGMQVWGLVGKARQAKRELDAGVDAVVAAGHDAAGHTGAIGTFSLVPQVVAIADGKPVIAAGGITTGRHLAAAITLGAVGAWTGTLWLASRESDKEMAVKERILSAIAEDTVHSACVSGFTMRTLRTKWHDEWAKPEAPRPAPAPFQLLLSGEVMQAAREQNLEGWVGEAAGQGVGFVTKMKPARQIVFDTVEEALNVFEETTGVVPGED